MKERRERIVVYCRPAICAFACLLALLAAAPAGAHFLLNLNVRIFHVEHLADGLRVYLRTPMPYLVADRCGPLGTDGRRAPAPYTTNRIEEGKLVHYVDHGELRRHSIGLGALASEGIRIHALGEPLKAVVEQVHVYRIGKHPDFSTLDEAKAGFATARVYPDRTDPLYVGDTMVDIVLRYQAGAPVYAYTVSSNLDPKLPGQENTANLILDYAPGGIQVFRARGLLTEPVAITHSVLAAITTFIKEGVRHILEGMDHVLFVLCLVLGATRVRSLVARITGFTVGHSVTLTIGFFGLVPSGAWFVPTVEAGIALSIIYAAALAVLPQREQNGSERKLFLVTSAIGLLHGLGFSFVLYKILQVNSPDIWQSLLAFNVGVEIGQLLIIILSWPLFRLVSRLSRPTWNIGRWAIAAGCTAVAVFWTGERVISIIASL
jgi:hydrogenase/urease accessory protein HupE